MNKKLFIVILAICLFAIAAYGLYIINPEIAKFALGCVCVIVMVCALIAIISIIMNTLF